MRKNVLQLFLVGVIVISSFAAFAAGPGDIKWDKPAPMVERITGKVLWRSCPKNIMIMEWN